MLCCVALEILAMINISPPYHDASAGHAVCSAAGQLKALAKRLASRALYKNREDISMRIVSTTGDGEGMYSQANKFQLVKFGLKPFPC